MPANCAYPGCDKSVFAGSAYCSKSHRDNASKQAPSSTCLYAGCSKPVFSGSMYCSKGHRDGSGQSQANGQRPPAKSTAPAPAAGAATASAQAHTHRRGRLCQLEGCSKSVFPGSQYCSKGHRDAASKGQASAGGHASSATNGTTAAPPPGGAPVSAATSSGGAPGQGSTSVIETCHLPRCSKPVFQGSLYCSKGHRDQATVRPASSQAPSSQVQVQTQGASQPLQPSNSSPAVCSYPGCSKAVFPGGLYCSVSHRDNAPGSKHETPAAWTPATDVIA